MKTMAALLLIVMVACTAFAENTSADTNLSPAERSIAQAKRMIEKQ
jgi:hypothetical protein